MLSLLLRRCAAPAAKTAGTTTTTATMTVRAPHLTTAAAVTTMRRWMGTVDVAEQPLSHSSPLDTVTEASSAPSSNPAGVNKMRFRDFSFNESLLNRLDELKFNETFGVQSKTFEATMAGRDVIARAATGTGKTLAFVLPTMHKLGHENRRENRAPGMPRALILTPTRELASQISDVIQSLATAARIRQVAIYGGKSTYTQKIMLRKGVDIVVGTPGRVNDFINRGDLSLRDVEIMVLDEADEMMTRNFMDQIERMFTMTKPVRQTLLFSATLPLDVKYMVKKFMVSPEIIDVTSTETAIPKNIKHELLCVPSPMGRAEATANMLLTRNPHRCIIFTNTKIQANELATYLDSRGISAVALQGDMSQDTRERSLGFFKRGYAKVLVATDVAARGIDVNDCDLVIQTDIPAGGHEAYIHRSGRTGRAGKAGTSVLMYGRGRTDQGWLRDLNTKVATSFQDVELPLTELIRDLEQSQRVLPHEQEPMSLRIDENNTPGRMIKKNNNRGGMASSSRAPRFDQYRVKYESQDRGVEPRDRRDGRRWDSRSFRSDNRFDDRRGRDRGRDFGGDGDRPFRRHSFSRGADEYNKPFDGPARSPKYRSAKRDSSAPLYRPMSDDEK